MPSNRGVVLLMYSPIRDAVQHNAGQDFTNQVSDDHYKAESDIVVKNCIRPWLHLVHSITPGASIIIVCSHLESPPPGSGIEIIEWSQHVQRLAGYVYEKVSNSWFTSTNLSLASTP